MNNRQRKLRMEQMEAREMMAGDVSASVVKGTLYLTETTGQTNRDNAVLISQIAPGRVRVEGIGTTTDGTIGKVNGAAFQDFTVPGGLSVKFAGGSDLVVFKESAPPSFTTANIDLALPAVPAGSHQPPAKVADNDNLIMWGGNIKGALTVNTGAQEDWVYLGNVTAGSATINTGAGVDEVSLEGAHILHNLDIQTYGVKTENDADVVNFDADTNLVHPTMVDGNASIRMGAGDDGLYSTNPNTPDSNVYWLGLHTHGYLAVDMGTGNDFAYLRNIRVDGDFSMDMGAGADTIDMRQTVIEGEFGFLPAVSGTMTVQMYTAPSENDADIATFTKIGVVGNMNVLMGAGNDQLTITGGFAQKDTTLDMGAGNDTVHLNQVTAYDNFFANLGDGNDVLDISDLYVLFKATKIDGGAGNDSLNKIGSFPTNQVTQPNFEWINGHPQPGAPVSVPTDPGRLLVQ